MIYCDETGFPVDGDQHWVWTFVTDEDVFYTFDESRGSQVLEDVLGDELAEDATLSCDGWSAYPSYHGKLQRCWAHLLREAKYVAERHEEAEPISEVLHDLHDDLTAFDEEDPPASARERRRAQASLCLEELIKADYEAEEVTQLAEKIRKRTGLLADVCHGARLRFNEQSRGARSARAGGDAEDLRRTPIGNRSPHSRDALDDGGDVGASGTRSAQSVDIGAGRRTTRIADRDIYDRTTLNKYDEVVVAEFLEVVAHHALGFGVAHAICVAFVELARGDVAAFDDPLLIDRRRRGGVVECGLQRLQPLIRHDG